MLRLLFLPNETNVRSMAHWKRFPLDLDRLHSLLPQWKKNKTTTNRFNRSSMILTILLLTTHVSSTMLSVVKRPIIRSRRVVIIVSIRSRKARPGSISRIIPFIRRKTSGPIQRISSLAMTIPCRQHFPPCRRNENEVIDLVEDHRICHCRTNQNVISRESEADVEILSNHLDIFPFLSNIPVWSFCFAFQFRSSRLHVTLRSIRPKRGAIIPPGHMFRLLSSTSIRRSLRPDSSAFPTDEYSLQQRGIAANQRQTYPSDQRTRKTLAWKMLTVSSIIPVEG